MQKSKKVVILGHFGVGKTSLIRRFVENSFSDAYKVTIGVHITKKVVELSGKDSVSLILWDLEGTDDIASIRAAYLMGTHGLVFVFDVSRPSTFQQLDADLKLLANKISGIPQLIVGNKIDLVDKTEVGTLLKSENISYDFLTSAKTGGDVEEMFVHLAALLNADA